MCGGASKPKQIWGPRPNTLKSAQVHNRADGSRRPPGACLISHGGGLQPPNDRHRRSSFEKTHYIDMPHSGPPRANTKSLHDVPKNPGMLTHRDDPQLPPEFAARSQAATTSRAKERWPCPTGTPSLARGNWAKMHRRNRLDKGVRNRKACRRQTNDRNVCLPAPELATKPAPMRHVRPPIKLVQCLPVDPSTFADTCWC